MKISRGTTNQEKKGRAGSPLLVLIFFQWSIFTKGKPVSPRFCEHPRIHTTIQKRNITQQLKYSRRVKCVLCKVNTSTSNRYTALYHLNLKILIQHTSSFSYFAATPLYIFCVNFFLFCCFKKIYLKCIVPFIFNVWVFVFFIFLLWWSKKHH